MNKKEYIPKDLDICRTCPKWIVRKGSTVEGGYCEVHLSVMKQEFNPARNGCVPEGCTREMEYFILKS